MTDRKQLLKDLQRQVKDLEADLRTQVEQELPEVRSRLYGEYERAFGLGRTAATWTVWRDERITQAAVAWVLGTVFVRYCEDGGLLGDSVYLAGPDATRMALAEESHEEHFRRFPSQTDRDWLLAAFDEIGQSQAGRLLFDREHNALYQIPVSHDAAKALIGFWRRRSEDGTLVHDFADEDTRFLGDLYQDLSEAARKTYALLQTPPFVEDFILELSLKPAIDEFGLDTVRLIDPTCGSGHFLLGAFERLRTAWKERAPTKDRYERVRLALDAVHGVDINPFAVAIARFRLLVEALQVAGFRTLEETKGYEFPLHIAIGDSLIKHRQVTLFEDIDELAAFRYATEDLDSHPGILREGRYHVVVGNPPYVTVKDPSLNEAYRKMYNACAGKYALSVPFFQRFFELARPGSGYVSQITASSFATREFGKRLITDFIRTVNLTLLVDCSKAFIPGHATSTIIFAGRRQRPNASTIRAVLAKEGEQIEPDDPSQGPAWRAILDHYKEVGSENRWVSTIEIPRTSLETHPWSISSGEAVELLACVDRGGVARLGDRLDGRIGFASFPGQDEAFVGPRHWLKPQNCSGAMHRPLVTGDTVRDWTIRPESWALLPYDSDLKPLDLQSSSSLLHSLWPLRSPLRAVTGFGRSKRNETNSQWWTWYRWIPGKYRAPLSIVFAEVATHNHFVLDRGDNVFKQTAPVIKLPIDSPESTHLRYVGVLNSSTGNFWCRQNCHDKGGGGNGRGIATEPWEHMLQRSGTRMQEFPLPAEYPLELARELDRLAQQLSAVSPASVAAEATPTRERLAHVEAESHATRARMIALQEELDWQVYRLYGLLDDELTINPGAVPGLNLGERAFEIVLARRMARGEAETQWFARHGSTPITELPDHWPAEYRAMVERRIAVIESNRHIGLIERPECKRRWATDGWDTMRAKALREWLLDRCEAGEHWHHHVDGVEQPRPLSVNQLADELRRDPDMLAVAELYAPGKDLAKVLADLIADEHVPFLTALRYKPSGLDKRKDWEDVWVQQRAEDAAPDEPARKKIRDAIPVPPKYASSDFVKPSYWRNRGKLDVPKERFISYPQAGRDGDPSLLIGWAGWDHREQAQALAILVVEREQTDGWDTGRLTPLLAGLREMLPWVRQWHDEFDAGIGDSPAAVYDGFLAETTNRLHLTDDDLTTWRPPTAARRAKRS